MTDTTIASAEDAQTAPDEGQVVETTEATAETPQEEYDFLEVTELGEKYVKLQVDGEEIAVPISEALAGYQRQADYTRKTQELSEQRKQLQFAATLQEALQKDPESTLRLLQVQFGTTQAPYGNTFRPSIHRIAPFGVLNASTNSARLRLGLVRSDRFRRRCGQFLCRMNRRVNARSSNASCCGLAKAAAQSGTSLKRWFQRVSLRMRHKCPETRRSCVEKKS